MASPLKTKAKAVPKRSALEATLEWQLKAAKLWVWFKEAAEDKHGGKLRQIIPGRRFEWDFVSWAALLCIECQGGIFRVGGHSTAAGISRDAEKNNLAQLAGWTQLTFTKAMIDDGTALRQIEEFLKR